MQSHFLDYVVLPGKKRKSSDNYYGQIIPELRLTVQGAIRCIADLPEDWVRNGENNKDHEPWKSLLDWVDALAYDFYESLNHTLTAAQSREDVAPFEWWMLVGRFIEQAPFRRRARDFYQDLLRLSEDYGWPGEHHEQIRQRLQQYEQRYKLWLEESRRRSQIKVTPGARLQSDLLEVKSMNNRAEALIKFMPDEYQVRFQLAPEISGRPYISRQDPEIEVSGPEVVPRGLRWRLRSNTGSAEWIVVEWSQDNRLLYVRADQKFVVSFAEPETRTS